MDVENGPSAEVGPGDEPVISYAEAVEHVGRAYHGVEWAEQLTDDERHALAAGPPSEASSVEIHRLAEAKSRMIAWRHREVDNWLFRNGLLDPIPAQYGFEPPPIPAKKFIAAWVPVFGESGVQLPDQIERLMLALTEQYSDHRIAPENIAPWSPPNGLTLDIARTVFGHKPRLFLTEVLELLAFGTSHPTRENDAYPGRLRAAADALFKGVSETKGQVLLGSRDRQNDEWMQDGYFDIIPRTLGNEDNSIETDIAKLSDEQFSAAFGNHRTSQWFNVRLDADFFFGWLRKQLTRNLGIPGLEEVPTENGGFIMQAAPPSDARYPAPTGSNGGGFTVSVLPMVDAYDSELRDTLEAAHTHHVDGGPAVPRMQPEYSKSELHHELDRIVSPKLMTIESRTNSKPVAGSGKKRGQKSMKRDKVKEAMRADLADGLKPADLYAMPEKQWDKYPAERTTCRQARNEILAECAARAARDGDEDTLAELSKIAASDDKLFELSAALAEIGLTQSRQTPTIDK